jgi:Tol biopolymer transport system component
MSDTNLVSDIYRVERATGVTTLVSRGPVNELGRASASNPTVSGDGRYVAFVSSQRSYDLLAPTNFPTVFLRDTVANTTTMLPMAGANGASELPSISNDGGVVAFESVASNLVAGDTNALSDVFVWERTTGAVRRVSLTAGGVQLAAFSARPAVSPDGSSVAFITLGRFVAEDLNSAYDAYVTRLASGAVVLLSASGTPASATGGIDPTTPSTSTNGDVVAFTSVFDLIPSDTNGLSDVYLRDINSAGITRMSVSATGVQGDGVSSAPAISADGNRVAFQTNATNLVAGDTNGVTDIYQRVRSANTTIRVSTNSDGAQHSDQAVTPASSADGLTIAFSFQSVIFGKQLG